MQKMSSRQLHDETPGAGHTRSTAKLSLFAWLRLVRQSTPEHWRGDPFHRPQIPDVIPADHGVLEGHQTNDRIVKLSKDGAFITAWGKHGSAPGEFDVPHSLALDSAGLLYVGDRSNNRVQIFDQSGKFIAEWKQFGPSSVYMDKNDTIYVADSQSDDKTNPGFNRDIQIGSVKDGKVAAFIPLTDPAIGSAEELAVDDQGNVFAGFTAQGKMAVRKFVKN